MTEEEIYILVFKIILIVLYTSFSIIRINITRLKRKANKSSEINEGKFSIAFLQIYIILTVILFMIFVFAPQLFDWSKIPNYPQGLQWTGTALGILSIILFIFVHKHLGRNYSRSLEIFDDHKLISTGPYKFVRHPMYSAFVLLHIAVFLITENWFFGIVWIGGLTIVLILRIKREEDMLIEAFGDNYKFYKEKTGILFPNLIKIFRNKQTDKNDEK
ncbi:MAG: isoprenylcysteine carboxylmethyltransferase family protein [Asgard group archaeon]|nr:isoprenylcysteine carboxylmethyltransferase family protein [Asgard group archaeon]